MSWSIVLVRRHGEWNSLEIFRRLDRGIVWEDGEGKGRVGEARTKVPISLSVYRRSIVLELMFCTMKGKGICIMERFFARLFISSFRFRLG